MATFTKVFMILILSSFSWAQMAPKDSEFYLWNDINDPIRASGTKQYCATTKNQPFNPTLCFGELPRANRYDRPSGYVKVQNGTRTETLKINGVSKWLYLGSTKDYVYNSEIYARKLTLVDNFGRKSEVTEHFHYHPKMTNWYGKTRTYGIYGKLPDGTSLKLENIYMFY